MVVDVASSSVACCSACGGPLEPGGAPPGQRRPDRAPSTRLPAAYRQPARPLTVRQILATMALLLVGCRPHHPARVPYSTDAIVNGCVLGVSCSPERGSVDDCVSQLSSARASGNAPTPFDYYAECGAISADCAAMTSCLAYGHGADYCAAHGYHSCDGAILLTCAAPTSSPLITADCAKLGLQCQERGDGQAACTNGQTCDPQQPQRCDGYDRVVCDPSGLLTRYDCDAYWPGSECRATSGFTGCYLPGASCKSDPIRCEGEKRISCVVGADYVTDCTELGETCVTDDSGASPRCASSSSTCVSNPCLDGLLHLCIGAIDEAFDCASVGLTACVIGAMGAADCR